MKHDQSRFSAAQAYRGEISDRVNRFMPMVRKQAWHLAGSGRSGLEVEDLMQAGLVALIECAQKHDAPVEDGFAAYAKMRVRGAMIDMLRAASPNARGSAARRRDIERAEHRLEQRLHRTPTDVEIATELGINIDAYHALRNSSQALSLLSVDDLYSESSTDFADDQPDPEMQLLDTDDREALISAIQSLPDRLQLIVQLYFVEELNLAEIAEVVGVSVPRVHQLKASALAKLKVVLTGAPHDNPAAKP